jgi:non-ribosomal peptide synthetase component F
VWYRQWLEGSVAKQQLEYWKQKLRGLPKLRLSARPVQKRIAFSGAVEATHLSADLADALNACARRYNVTPFVLALAAFKETLREVTGEDDVVVGTPTAGRRRPEVEPVFGYFVNMLALRTDLSGTRRRSEAIERVNNTVLDALQHQDVPFLDVVTAVDPNSVYEHSPIYNVQFTMSNLVAKVHKSQANSDLKWNMSALDIGNCESDLMAAMYPESGGLDVRFQFSTEILTRGEVADMLSTFVKRLVTSFHDV